MSSDHRSLCSHFNFIEDTAEAAAVTPSWKQETFNAGSTSIGTNHHPGQQRQEEEEEEEGRARGGGERHEGGGGDEKLIREQQIQEQ